MIGDMDSECSSELVGKFIVSLMATWSKSSNISEPGSAQLGIDVAPFFI
jgi:hypothetical protein